MKLKIITLIISMILMASCSQTYDENSSQIAEMQDNETTDHMSVVGTTNQFLNIVDSQNNNDIISKEVVYYNDVKGYLTRPDDENSYPGVIMIHEWWELNENMKNKEK
jgi:carboxymethylenebutenolidase